MENNKQMVLDILNAGAIQYSKNTLLIYSSIVKYELIKDYIFYIDIITTPTEFRKQGSASKTLEFLTTIAKMNNVKITLVCASIKKHKESLLTRNAEDLAGIVGYEKKKSIKVKDLPKFYSKFGFEITDVFNTKVVMAYN